MTTADCIRRPGKQCKHAVCFLAAIAASLAALSEQFRRFQIDLKGWAKKP